MIIYRCATCKSKTNTNEEMEKHFVDAHSIHCKICDYKNGSKLVFERHMEFAHNKLPKSTCKICNEEFIGNDNFDKHLEFTHGTNHWSLNLGIKQAHRMIKGMN